MKNTDIYYKEFLINKIKSPKTYLNLIKKIHSFEDFRYALGLMKLGLKIFLSKTITNDTVRGR